MVPERPYIRLNSRYLWQSRWYNLRQDTLRAADGSELTYTLIEKPLAVWVVPVTPDGQIVLIEQYRYAIDDWCLEVPAGTVEPGMDPAGMASRELLEETGGVARSLVPLGEFYTMTGIGTGAASLFVALGVTLGTPRREPTEHIRVRLVPADEALSLARSGAIKAGVSTLALLLGETTIRDYLVERTS